MDDQITFCPNCGAFVEPDTVFCKNCGNQVKNTSANASAEKPIVSAPPMPPKPSSQPAAMPQQPPIPMPPKPMGSAPESPATPPQPAAIPARPQMSKPQQPEMPSQQPAPKKSNIGLILGIIGGVILLTVVGVGIYFALDNDKPTSSYHYEETAPTKDIVNDYSDNSTDKSADNSSNDFSSDLDSESGKSYDTPESSYSFGSPHFENAFTKIYNDQLLTHSDIISLSTDELRILRNLPFAQAGRKFQSPDLTEFFSQFDWYTPLYNDVSVNNLTPNDRENINLIQKYE